MDAWIKSPVDMWITDKLCPLIVTGMMPLHLGGGVKGDVTTAMLCCCLQFLV